MTTIKFCGNNITYFVKGQLYAALDQETQRFHISTQQIILVKCFVVYEKVLQQNKLNKYEIK